MQERWSPMRAAIDIGSNTIHIVVARSTPNDLDIVADEVDLVRIGESVTASGEISPEKRDAALAVLSQYKALAEQHGAEQIFVVATEAIRQARNSAEFLADIQRETSLKVDLISGDVEATLTFYGATYEAIRDSQAPAQMGVMDLGGGSTELITARNGYIAWKTSVPIGSGWLHDRYLPSDPPSTDELEVAYTFLRTYFRGMRIKMHPSLLIVTGGSANSLLYLARRAYRLDMNVSQLTSEDLMRCEGLLSALPAEEVAQRYEQPVGRALILPAGALIIREVMVALRLNAISVSPHGIREGVLLARERYGEEWLERVEELAASKNNGQKRQETIEDNGEGEPFIKTGRRLIGERTKKLLEWREEVLKNEDIEAIHKMRVATRRLRATLDAYQFCCDPGAFKQAYRQIKHIADVLGAARDTDIMLESMRKQCKQVPVEEQPGVKWLIDRLTVYRQQKQQEIEQFFAQLDQDALEQLLLSCIRQDA